MARCACECTMCGAGKLPGPIASCEICALNIWCVTLLCLYLMYKHYTDQDPEQTDTGGLCVPVCAKGLITNISHPSIYLSPHELLLTHFGAPRIMITTFFLPHLTGRCMPKNKCGPSPHEQFSVMAASEPSKLFMLCYWILLIQCQQTLVCIAASVRWVRRRKNVCMTDSN